MSQKQQELQEDTPVRSVVSVPALERQQREQQYPSSSRQYHQYSHVIPGELHIFIPLTMVFIILLITAVASLGAASIFVPLFVGVVVTYVAGSLYLFKKLMTY
jgi:hypothetical protein